MTQGQAPAHQKRISARNAGYPHYDRVRINNMALHNYRATSRYGSGMSVLYLLPMRQNRSLQNWYNANKARVSI